MARGVTTHTISSKRVFPQKLCDTSSCVPLSIIDATVNNFAPCGAVWFFPPTSLTSVVSTELLESTLALTLDYYPQFSGGLHWAPHLASGNWKEKWGRLRVTFGKGKGVDPGVEFVIAECDITLDSLVPSRETRVERGGVWDASQASLRDLVPPTDLAPTSSPNSVDEDSQNDAPCLVVQITTFKCGGKAISLQASHPMADAIALSFFVKDWAANTKAFSEAKVQQSSDAIAIIKPLPCFNPSLLDKCSAGDINSSQPDMGLIKTARALPSHRYDWWDLSASDCPWDSTAATIPTVLQANWTLLSEDSGKSMPWKDWDTSLPISHYIIHFYGSEIRAMWEAISKDVKASKHDALVTHIWACINRARGLADDEENVHLDMTLGLRARVSPALPDKFMGSPIILADVTASGREASSGEATAMVKKIKSTMACFTSSTIAAHLHDKLHVASPQRIWQAFQGKRHIILTSWVHNGVHDVDFGDGKASYVEAIMPPCDGCVQVMESPSKQREVNVEDTICWWERGVDISVHLETKAMERLLKEPLLRKYFINI